MEKLFKKLWIPLNNYNPLNPSSRRLRPLPPPIPLATSPASPRHPNLPVFHSRVGRRGSQGRAEPPIKVPPTPVPPPHPRLPPPHRQLLHSHHCHQSGLLNYQGLLFLLFSISSCCYPSPEPLSSNSNYFSGIYFTDASATAFCRTWNLFRGCFYSSSPYSSRTSSTSSATYLNSLAVSWITARCLPGVGTRSRRRSRWWDRCSSDRPFPAAAQVSVAVLRGRRWVEAPQLTRKGRRRLGFSIFTQIPSS